MSATHMIAVPIPSSASAKTTTAASLAVCASVVEPDTVWMTLLTCLSERNTGNLLIWRQMASDLLSAWFNVEQVTLQTCWFEYAQGRVTHCPAGRNDFVDLADMSMVERWLGLARTIGLSAENGYVLTFVIWLWIQPHSQWIWVTRWPY